MVVTTISCYLPVLLKLYSKSRRYLSGTQQGEVICNLNPFFAVQFAAGTIRYPSAPSATERIHPRDRIFHEKLRKKVEASSSIPDDLCRNRSPVFSKKKIRYCCCMQYALVGSTPSIPSDFTLFMTFSRNSANSSSVSCSGSILSDAMLLKIQ